VARDSGEERPPQWRSQPFDPNDTLLRGSVHAMAERRRVVFASGEALSRPGSIDAFADLVTRASGLGANQCPACGPWVSGVTLRLAPEDLAEFASLEEAAALNAFVAERGLPGAPPCWFDGQHLEPAEAAEAE
jgi:hypothetical protein